MKNMPETSRKSPHPVDVHVGERVRLRRMMVGMSQDKLADALGLTFQQVQKYEKGANRIGASRLFQIANILSVPVQFFYDNFTSEIDTGVSGFAEENSANEFMDLLTTPEGVQLCRAYSQITDQSVRRKLLDLMKSLAESA